MADTKYLQKRGNCWYIRVPSPPDLWGMSGEFVCSLRTPDLKVAQRLRDKYLYPILAETAAAGMVRTIARCASAADEAIEDQLAELRPNLTGVQETVTLREASDHYLDYLESSRSYSPATLRKYSTSLDAACELLGEETDLESISTSDATDYRDRLLNLPVGWQLRKDDPVKAQEGERKVSGATVNRYLSDLRRLYDWLITEDRIRRQDNPFEGIKVARTKTTHKRAPTLAEADQLLELKRPRSIDELTWATMPILARYTGCRAGELSQLRTEDVVERRGVRCFRVTSRGKGKTLKTSSSERLVPVAEELVPHLEELLEERSDGRLLYPGDWEGDDGTVKHAHKFLKYYNRRAKDVASDLSFHCWRVYANDAMASAGVDIGDRERLLGHSSNRTQSAYTPENLERLKEAVDSIP